jgi:modified peptide precursor CbpA
MAKVRHDRGFLFGQNIKEVIGLEKKARKMKKGVIAYRRKCKASGTGLSHYVLLEKENKS